MKPFLTLILSLVLFSCVRTFKENKDNSTPVKPEQQQGDDPQLIVWQHKYHLGSIEVKLRHSKSPENCKVKLVISKNGFPIDSLFFEPEAVGGDYGISIPRLINNHLVFTKHGDYNGRTIIVNEEGAVFNIIGGQNHHDPQNKLLFSIYESDVSGFAVFDLEKDSLLMEMVDFEDYPVSFHKTFGQRFFMKCDHYENKKVKTAIWELELELNRAMMVDLDANIINGGNELNTFDQSPINCEPSTDSTLSNKQIEKKAIAITEIMDEENINIFSRWNFMLNRKAEIWSKTVNNTTTYSCSYFKSSDSATILVYSDFLHSTDFPLKIELDTSKFSRFGFIKTLDQKIGIIGINHKGENVVLNSNLTESEIFENQSPFLKLATLSKLKDELGVYGILHMGQIGDFIQFYVSLEDVLTFIPDYSTFNPKFKENWIKEFSKGTEIKANWNLRRLDDLAINGCQPFVEN